MTKKPKAKDTKFSKDNQPATRGEGEVIAKSNTKRRVMTDALMISLNRVVDGIAETDGKPTRRLTQIADKLAEKAAEGDTQAIKEIFDRTEGKAAQAIIHQGDADKPVETKYTVEFVNATPADKP